MSLSPKMVTIPDGRSTVVSNMDAHITLLDQVVTDNELAGASSSDVDSAEQSQGRVVMLRVATGATVDMVPLTCDIRVVHRHATPCLVDVVVLNLSHRLEADGDCLT